MTKKQNQLNRLREHITKEYQKIWYYATVLNIQTVLRPAKENEKWMFSTEEAAAIVHEYLPAISVTVEDNKLTIFN